MFESSLDVISDLNSELCKKNRDIDNLKLVIQDRDRIIEDLKKKIDGINSIKSEDKLKVELDLENLVKRQQTQIVYLQRKLQSLKDSWNNITNILKED